MENNTQITPYTKSGIVNWQSNDIPLDYLDKLEQMLLHSAMMTGANADATVITATAKLMAPILMAEIPIGVLDAVYTRLITRMMADPNQRSVMATPAGFLATWRGIQAEAEAERARDEEETAERLRSAMMRVLRAEEKPVHHIADLAARDGVQLPWLAVSPDATGATTLPSEARKSPEPTTNTRDDITGLRMAYNRSDAEYEAIRAERNAIIARNREAWLKMSAEHEANKDSLGAKTERADNAENTEFE